MAATDESRGCATGCRRAHRTTNGLTPQLVQRRIKNSISLFTVYRQAQAYAQANHQPPLRLDEGTDIHAVRNHQRGPLVSTLLFDPLPPEPLAYLAATRNAFGSEFFRSLQRMLREQGTDWRTLKTKCTATRACASSTPGSTRRLGHARIGAQVRDRCMARLRTIGKDANGQGCRRRPRAGNLRCAGGQR